MKKIVSIMLVALLLCGVAFAAEILPQPCVNMDDMSNCTLHVAFGIGDVTDSDITVKVCEETRYDAVEIANLAVGDTIVYCGNDVTVESISTEDGVEINGGAMEGGITLRGDEGGTYVAIDYDLPVYIEAGKATLPLADQITYSHWQQDSEGGIMEEPAVKTVASSELAAALQADEESGEFYPDSTSLVVEGGVVTEVIISYVP